MKKNLKLFLTMLFLTLLGGANSSWAEEHTVIFKTTGNDSDSSTKQTTIDGLVSEGGDIFSAVTTSNAYQAREGRGVKLGTSKANGSMVFTLTQSMKVTSIKFTAMRYNESEYSITVNGQNFTALTSSMTEYTVTLNGSAITEISISTPSKRAYIGSLTIVTSGGTTGPVDPNVFFANESEEIEVGETVTNELTKPDDLTVTFSSNPSSVATVDANGVVTGVAEGEATITASWTAVPNKYNAGSASYTVTVNAATPAVNFVKVTNSNQLVAGNEYILVGTRAGKTAAMGARTGSNTYRDEVLVTVTDDKVAVKGNDGVAVLTLGGASDSWTFLASDNNEYIALTANSNALHSSTDATLETSKWKVTNDFQLQNASFTDRYIQYNSGSTRFACYTAGNQGLSTLYVKEGSPIDDKLDPNFVFSATEVETEVGGEFTAPTLTHAEGFYGTIIYASSNPDVATVDASTGEVTIVAAGETTISATSEAYDNFKAGSASYTLTVIDPNAPGTANNPYTVAQARAAIDANTGMVGVYATGIVSQTDGLSNGTITYYISDDGTTTNQLEIYKGKSYDGVNFTSADDIQVGDIVVVYGNLQKYNSIYEFNATNRLVSLVRPVVPSHDVTFSANGTAFSTTTAKEGANIEFPTENPTDEGDFKFIGWSTEDWTGEVDDRPATLVTSATMGTEDMTIYAVYAIATEGTSVRWKKMAASEISEEGTYAIITSTEGDDAYYAFNGTISDGHGQTTPTYFTFDTEGYADSAPAGTCELIFEASGEGFKMRTEDLTANGNKPYLCASKAASGGLTWLNSSDYWSYTSDNWTYSKYFDGTNHYAYLRQYDNTVRTYGTNNGRKIEFAQKVGSITYSNYCTIISGFEKVTLSTDGYITYVTKNAIDWVQTLARNSQEGVDVHGYKVVDFSLDNGVSMVEYGVENLSTVASTDKMYQEPIIPAGTPIIIQGKQGDNYMVVADEENVTAPAGNLLRASNGTATTTDEVKLFVLQKIDQSGSGINNYTFYRLTKGRQIPVGKAYLSSEDMTLPNPGTPGVDPNNMPAANFIRILVQTDNDSLVSDDAGIIDGIGTVAQDSEDGQVIYNLNGVKVNNPSKGIYVKNGKKVIIK